MLLGQGVCIGKQTGKIVKYEVQSKSYRICQSAKTLKQKARVHRCSKNWSGSAKAMEPDMAVKMMQSLKANNVTVKQLIMDDDAATFSRARSTVNPNLEKVSDKTTATRP